jgi:hypothetical protein
MIEKCKNKNLSELAVKYIINHIKSLEDYDDNVIYAPRKDLKDKLRINSKLFSKSIKELYDNNIILFRTRESPYHYNIKDNYYVVDKYKLMEYEYAKEFKFLRINF